MKPFPWWTEEHIAFQKEVSVFAKEIAPRDAVTRWTREFPYDIYRKIGEKGYTEPPFLRNTEVWGWEPPVPAFWRTS